MVRRVAVFGIFDGVHEGHRDLFKQARALGDGLLVIVGRDEIAQQLKGKEPKYSETERIEMLEKEPLVNDAVLGDKELSTYVVLERYNPDIVCLGYDQQELEADLREWLQKQDRPIDLHRAKPYRDGTLHSSNL